VTPRDDSGVTLIEVLVAMVIVSMLAVVIASAISVGYKTTDTTISRLAGSQGAQISAAFFPSDIQSAATITLGTAACTGAVPIAAVSWADTDPAAVTINKQTQYALRMVGTEQQLVRRYYEGCVLIGTVVLVHNATVASVTCAPSCAAPLTATLNATEVGTYAFSVTGRRRMT
jgi:prepilin-type N-terminal cleavage/methylation domain-containing protein